jgi:hypothetical protein
MTVATSTAKSGPYAGSGTTGPFTVGFRFLENAHIQVIRTSSTGVDTTLALTTDYTVTGAGGASGSVTLVTALAVGQQLTIIRNVPFTQEADYVQNDAFPAESHERALDKLTMQTQQLLEAVNRAAKLPVTSTEDAQALTDDITLLADNLTTINAVAGSLGDIDTVATSIGDVNTVADNLADVTNFADVYYGPSATDPTLRNDGTALMDGDLYFNTTTNVMRVYGGGGWIDAGAALPITINEQVLNGTGSQTAFTLSSAPAYTAALEVFVGGVRQSTTAVYSVSGTTLTFTAAPPAGTGNIFCRWVSPIAVGVPSDGSVTTAKIQDGAVTTAKIPSSAITQEKLGAGVAGRGPAFSATDAATTATAGVTTKIIFDTEVFDTNSAFDGTKFQPTVAGYYQINGILEAGGSGSSGGISISVYINGAAVRTSSSAILAGFSSLAAVMSTLVYLNGSTDYLEFFGRNSSNANLGAASVSAFLARSAT